MRRRRFLRLGLAAPFFLSGPALARDEVLKIRQLYEKTGEMSDLALDRIGSRVTFEGFMAPPLKAESRFFVLTKMPMAICPFCETEAEWPRDILAVYSKRTVEVLPFNVRIEVRGVLEVGAYKDPETGFVSLVRLTDASYERP